MNSEIIPDNYQPPSSDDPRGPLERSLAALQRMEREVLLTGRLRASLRETTEAARVLTEAQRGMGTAAARLSGAARKRREWQRRVEAQQARAAARLARAQAAARGEPEPDAPKVLRGRQGVRRAQGQIDRSAS